MDKKNNIVIMFVIALLFFAFISLLVKDVYINDGVLRNETGTPIVQSDNSLVTTDYVHYKNHLGDSFLLSYNDILNVGGVAAFMGCPQTKDVHFTAMHISANSAPVRVELFENPTVTANGTVINMTNMNRNFANVTQDMMVYSDPTVTATGTLLFEDAVVGNNRALEGFSLEGEIILSPSNCYLFQMTNEDGNNNEVFANLFIYEE